MNASSGPPETAHPADQGGARGEGQESGATSKVDLEPKPVKRGDLLEGWIGCDVLVLARADERFAGRLEAVSAGELLVRGVRTGRPFVIARRALIYVRLLESFDTSLEPFVLTRMAWS